MGLATAAVLSVAGLIGSFIAAPVVDSAQEHSDPADIASPAAVQRAETLSRSNERAPLPSSTPSASPTPSPSPMPSETPTAAAPEPAAAPSSEASSEPEPTEQETPEFGEVIGEAWTTAAVNVRSGPGTGFGVVTTLQAGDGVEVTNVVVDDRWQQVRVGDEIGFISNKYLTDEEPEPAAEAASEESGSSDSEEPVEEGAVSTEACAAAAGIESGVTDRTVQALRAICNEFPSITNYGGSRSGGGSYHSTGQAIDVMVSGEAGWEVARWVRANASELGVIEVIYAQNIWTTQRAGEGWRPMSDRGSASANHYDHVHVSVG